jgi:alkylation response protein AidB-like acyl-CoA dehydrogenase
VTIEAVVSSRGGPAHFFQEFLDDVRLPPGCLLGEADDGWRVAHTLLVHERNAIAGVGHGLGLGGGGEGGSDIRRGVADLVSVARRSGAISDPDSRRLIASVYVDETVRLQLAERVATGLRTGALQGNWGSLVKLGVGVDTLRRAEVALALARSEGVAWLDTDTHTGTSASGPDGEVAEVGLSWLTARGISIGGGTNEIQRNTISERLLDMPREPAPDRDVPFGEMIRRRARRDPTGEGKG